MTQDTESFINGFIAQLENDTALNGVNGWSQTNFNRTLTVVKGNALIEKISTKKLPALIIEIGDFESAPQVSGVSQTTEQDLPFSIVWHEDDDDAAFNQRTPLSRLIIQAVMADHTLGNNVEAAWISEGQSDQNAYHPTHVMRFLVTGQFAVKNN